MDANEIPINVYIDLSKAFDSMNYNILLLKLKFYGVMSSYTYLIEDSILNSILRYPFLWKQNRVYPKAHSSSVLYLH